MQQAVQIFVRIRPQKDRTKPSTISTEKGIIKIENPRNNSESIKYKFDKVFKKTTQNKIYTEIKPILIETLKGRNATFFAYGQTGSGKTHTMNGIPGEQRGIIPRVVETLLDEETAIKASFIEVYNEKIFDLLNKQAPLDLRETSDKQIIIAGITSVDIGTISEFQKYQSISLSKRQTASTSLNLESSRSHYILQLNIQKKDGLKISTSKIHLIDLAGSEDNKRTGNQGKRMNESCHINKSLFALGQVVEALNKSQTRIPYRESKITRFLQDSLGGNSIGVLIACCSSEPEDFIDTFNTLNFATKCSLVKNVVQTNEFLVKDLEAEANRRKLALDEWKKKKNIMEEFTSNSKPLKKKPSLGLPLRDLTLNENITQRDKSTTRDIENEINQQVEARVAVKLKELTDNLIRTKQLEKSVTDRFALVETRIIKKLQNTQMVSDHRLDGIKESTLDNIMFLLNHGSLKSLMTLKQIGKKRAEAILEARSNFGDYASLADMTRAGLKISQIDSIFKANIEMDIV